MPQRDDTRLRAVFMHLELSSEQQAFADAAAAFAREHVEPVAKSTDEQNAFPRAILRPAGRLGLLAVTAPTAVGGAGRDLVACALAVEAIARASASVATILVVQNSLVVQPLLRFGTDAQRHRWLPVLASGEGIGAFALSEPQAGTDRSNLQTTAARDGDGYRLNGEKVWVTNAAAASVAIVFAATGESGTMTAFLVPLPQAGVEQTGAREALGLRGVGAADLRLRDVRVGAADILGSPGQGAEIAKYALDEGQIGVAALAVGIAQAAFDEAVAQAKQRMTFGKPIGSNEAIQWMLADSATEIDAARLLTLKAAANRDEAAKTTAKAAFPETEPAMAKVFASEAASRTADRALQILGGEGYTRGSRVERLFRDARGTEIFQGTSEAQRMAISVGILGR